MTDTGRAGRALCTVRAFCSAHTVRAARTGRAFRWAAAALGVVAVAGALAVTPTALSGTAAAAAATRYPDTAGEPVPFGDATYFGSPANAKLAAPVVGMAATPTGKGYWLVAADGGVFSYGAARYYGSAAGLHLKSSVVGIAAAATGDGYWLVAANGGVFSYGKAAFHGSAANLGLKSSVVGIAATPTGRGYWLATSGGGVYSFGSARFYGAAATGHLAAPVVGIAADPAGGGYWLAASDGGVFSFGRAPFRGSAASRPLAAPVVGIAAAPAGTGYWLLGSNGAVLNEGSVKSYGSTVAQPLTSPIVAMAATPTGTGYWLLPGTPPTLEPGATGSAVLALQERLSSLGYWLGTPNGTFGDTTEQAVYALQKAAGIDPDGIVAASTYAALDRGVLPRPRSTSGYVIEVDLSDDLVMFVSNGKVQYVLNTSTGGGYTYTATGAPALAETPTGHFQIYREVDGQVVDSLGALWRPKYFDSGFAIHGDTYVPSIPVSHGCVRVSDAAIDWIWTTNKAPLGTAVWVY